jgi:uncharacterized membrane protein
VIQDKLENQIYNVIMETARVPKLIVMHPQTWVDLVKEVTGKDGMAINIYDPNKKYRGIKVLRSLDLLEGEFEM